MDKEIGIEETENDVEKEITAFDWEHEAAVAAKRNGDDSRIPDDWYCNVALILRGRKKDVQQLVNVIVPDLTECEETDFDVKVVYVRMSHKRFAIEVEENGNRNGDY